MGTVMMAALFGFLALAVDIGFLYYQHRRIQTAADGGAYSGAQEIRRGANEQVIASARKGSEQNGSTHGVNNINVTVNYPPTSGTLAGNAKALDVIAGQRPRTFFAAVMDIFSAGVCARGVAGFIGNSPNCVFALLKSRPGKH